jgi:hypothetical protein
MVVVRTGTVMAGMAAGRWAAVACLVGEGVDKEQPKHRISGHIDTRSVLPLRNRHRGRSRPMRLSRLMCAV